jgi:hypothetical protein
MNSGTAFGYLMAGVSVPSDLLQESEKTSSGEQDENTLARRALRLTNVVKKAGVHFDCGAHA